MKERILVAGIGNIFLGDDAFGVEVVGRLGNLPDSVRVVDFGIRGFDLVYALVDGYEATILVDATPRGGAPGTLYTIEPDLRQFDAPGMASFEAHNLDPVKVLGTVRAMGGKVNRLLVVGCEPSSLDDEEGGRMGLSEPVAAAVDEAVTMIESLVANILAKAAPETNATEMPHDGAEQKIQVGGPYEDAL
jgi:hydrogenase maturation protease